MKVFIYILAVIAASFGGHLLIHPIVERMRKRISEEDVERSWISSWLGCLERAMFVGAWLTGYPQFIGLWLSLKVAGGWKMWQEDAHSRGRFMVFLIGSGLSIGVAVIAALLAQCYLGNICWM